MKKKIIDDFKLKAIFNALSEFDILDIRPYSDSFELVKCLVYYKHNEIVFAYELQLWYEYDVISEFNLSDFIDTAIDDIKHNQSTHNRFIFNNNTVDELGLDYWSSNTYYLILSQLRQINDYFGTIPWVAKVNEYNITNTLVDMHYKGLTPLQAYLQILEDFNLSQRDILLNIEKEVL